jgi:hypothetical protein
MAANTRAELERLLGSVLPPKPEGRHPFDLIDKARMLLFAEKNMKKNGEIARRVWINATIVSTHSGVSMDSHYETT